MSHDTNHPYNVNGLADTEMICTAEVKAEVLLQQNSSREHAVVLIMVPKHHYLNYSHLLFRGKHTIFNYETIRNDLNN